MTKNHISVKTKDKPVYSIFAFKYEFMYICLCVSMREKSRKKACQRWQASNQY
jgi:hypothetical protein